MYFIFVFLQPAQRALVLARVRLSMRACESVKGNKGRFTVSRRQKRMSYTNQATRENAHIILFLSQRDTHAQGIRDSAAALITPNGSIRHSVMINPVESLPPPSVTCREAAPPPPALSALTDRWSSRGHHSPGGLQVLHKVT